MAEGSFQNPERRKCARTVALSTPMYSPMYRAIDELQT